MVLLNNLRNNTSRSEKIYRDTDRFKKNKFFPGNFSKTQNQKKKKGKRNLKRQNYSFFFNLFSPNITPEIRELDYSKNYLSFDRFLPIHVDNTYLRAIPYARKFQFPVSFHAVSTTISNIAYKYIYILTFEKTGGRRGGQKERDSFLSG